MAVPIGAGSFQPIGSGVLSARQAGAWQQLWPAVQAGLLLLAGTNTTLTKRVVAATSTDGAIYTEVSQPTIGSNSYTPMASTFANGAWWVVGPTASDVITLSKSVDDGATWEVSTITISGIGSNNTRFLFYRDGRWILGVGAGSGSGVFISDDDMATWTYKYSSPDFNERRLLVAPSGLAYINSASTAGFIFSTDNGSTWGLRSITGTSLVDPKALACDPTTDTIAAVATAANNGWRFYSKVGVATTSFSLTASGTYADSFAKTIEFGGGTWVILFQDGAVISSTDGGSTWTSPALTGLTSGIDLAYFNGTWIAFSATDIALSTDGGATWSLGALPTNFSPRFLGIKP